MYWILWGGLNQGQSTRDYGKAYVTTSQAGHPTRLGFAHKLTQCTWYSIWYLQWNTEIYTYKITIKKIVHSRYIGLIQCTFRVNTKPWWPVINKDHPRYSTIYSVQLAPRAYSCQLHQYSAWRVILLPNWFNLVCNWFQLFENILECSDVIKVYIQI